jgi:hypothetical protein
VLDSSGGNAVAQKNIEVGPPPTDPRKQPRPPIIPSIDGPLEAESGGELLLPAITDPNNDPVNVVWQIRQNNKLVKEGTGGNLVLNDVDPGDYVIQIKADDGMLTSSGQYDLIVVPAGTGTKKPPGPSKSPSGGARLDLDPRLPSLTLSQGATLEIDAGSTSIPIKDLAKYDYKWTLKNKATGQTVKTEEGQGVSLPLDNADSLQLQLSIIDPKSNLNSTGSSNLKVLPRPEGADPLPVISGRCGPFRSSPAVATKLTCRGRIEPQTADGEPADTVPLVWAWRVTKLRDQTIKTSVGAIADFGELEVGDYVVEAALGVNGPPTSTNTIYFLSTYLIVRETGKNSGASTGSSGSSGSNVGSSGSTPAVSPTRGSTGGNGGNGGNTGGSSGGNNGGSSGSSSGSSPSEEPEAEEGLSPESAQQFQSVQKQHPPLKGLTKQQVQAYWRQQQEGGGKPRNKQQLQAYWRHQLQAGQKRKQKQVSDYWRQQVQQGHKKESLITVELAAFQGDPVYDYDGAPLEAYASEDGGWQTWQQGDAAGDAADADFAEEAAAAAAADPQSQSDGEPQEEEGEMQDEAVGDAEKQQQQGEDEGLAAEDEQQQEDALQQQQQQQHKRLRRRRTTPSLQDTDEPQAASSNLEQPQEEQQQQQQQQQQRLQHKVAHKQVLPSGHTAVTDGGSGSAKQSQRPKQRPAAVPATGYVAGERRGAATPVQQQQQKQRRLPPAAAEQDEQQPEQQQQQKVPPRQISTQAWYAQQQQQRPRQHSTHSVPAAEATAHTPGNASKQQQRTKAVLHRQQQPEQQQQQQQQEQEQPEELAPVTVAVQRLTTGPALKPRMATSADNAGGSGAAVSSTARSRKRPVAKQRTDSD